MEQVMTVSDLLQKARALVYETYTDVNDARQALFAATTQANNINTCLNTMANAARGYVDDNVDAVTLQQTIRNNMNAMRVPVKELQLHLKRPVDTDAAPTEAEIRDFKEYVEGFCRILNERVRSLMGIDSDSIPTAAPITESSQAIIDDMFSGVLW